MKILHKLNKNDITACGKKVWKRGAYSWHNPKINCKHCLGTKGG